MQRVAILALVVGLSARADTPSEAPPTAQPPAVATPPAPAPATPDPIELCGPTISLEVPHAFPRASARERVGFLLDYWNHRFGVKAEWRGDSVFLTGRVLGMEIRARFDVSDSAVTGVAADPGWFWRNKAKNYVTRKLKKYLHPDYADP
ncbi:MAG: polyhydroxyalkanoic acid system family protein [Myxococcota bacterium]